MTKQIQGCCRRLNRRQLLKGLMVSATYSISSGIFISGFSNSTALANATKSKCTSDIQPTTDAHFGSYRDNEVSSYTPNEKNQCFASTETEIRDGILHFASLSSIVIVCNVYDDGIGDTLGICAKLGTDVNDVHQAVQTEEHRFFCALPDNYRIHHKIGNTKYVIDGRILRQENGILATRVFITAIFENGIEKSTSRLMNFKSSSCLNKKVA